MPRVIAPGSTGKSIYVVLQDVDGNPLSLVYNDSGLIASYTLNGGAAVSITLATLAAANSAWSSGGFKLVDATKHPGLHRLCLPNAALTGADSCVVTLTGYTNMVTVNEEIELRDSAADILNAVRASYVTAGTVGEALFKLGRTLTPMAVGTVTNTALTPTQLTFECSDITDATTSHWANRVAINLSGSKNGQFGGRVTGYSLVSGRGRFVVEGFPAAPSNGDLILII
jgi:hypothetical protein